MGGWEPHWESALRGPGPTRTRTEAKEGSSGLARDSQAPTGSHAPRRPAAVVLLTRLPMPKRTFCVKRHNYSKCTSQLSAKPEVTVSVPGGMDMWTRGLRFW